MTLPIVPLIWTLLDTSKQRCYFKRWVWRVGQPWNNVLKMNIYKKLNSKPRIISKTISFELQIKIIQNWKRSTQSFKLSWKYFIMRAIFKLFHFLKHKLGFKFIRGLVHARYDWRSFKTTVIVNLYDPFDILIALLKSVTILFKLNFKHSFLKNH